MMLQNPSPRRHVPPDVRVEHAKLADHPQRRIRIQPDQRQHLHHRHLRDRVQLRAQSAHTMRIFTAHRRVTTVSVSRVWRVRRRHTRLLLHRGAHHSSSTTPQTHRLKIAARLSPAIHWLFRTEIGDVPRYAERWVRHRNPTNWPRFGCQESMRYGGSV